MLRRGALSLTACNTRENQTCHSLAATLGRGSYNSHNRAELVPRAQASWSQRCISGRAGCPPPPRNLPCGGKSKGKMTPCPLIPATGERSGFPLTRYRRSGTSPHLSNTVELTINRSVGEPALRTQAWEIWPCPSSAIRWHGQGGEAPVSFPSQPVTGGRACPEVMRVGELSQPLTHVASTDLFLKPIEKVVAETCYATRLCFL